MLQRMFLDDLRFWLLTLMNPLFTAWELPRGETSSQQLPPSPQQPHFPTGAVLHNHQLGGMAPHQQFQLPSLQGGLGFSSDSFNVAQLRAVSLPAQHLEQRQQQLQQQLWQHASPPVPALSQPVPLPPQHSAADLQRSIPAQPASWLQQAWPPPRDAGGAAPAPACSMSGAVDVGGATSMDEDSPGLRQSNSAPDLHMMLQVYPLSTPQLCCPDLHLVDAASATMCSDHGNSPDDLCSGMYWCTSCIAALQPGCCEVL